VLKRFKERSKDAPTRAANEMRVLKLIFNFAKGAYKTQEGQSLFSENPVNVLNHLRILKPAKRKQTIIKKHQLKPWFDAVCMYDLLLDELKTSTIRDYLIFSLLTGLRREEAARLAWENVDLTGKVIIIKDTKNHDDFELPLSDYLLEMLQRRFQQCGEQTYVFPGNGKTGHIINPNKAIDRVREQSGVHFTMHDLRRTFITVAESLDISQYTLKRLINHRTDSNDVTAGYIIADVDRLREPMQRITDFILEHATIKKEL
jgi:integrase